MHGYYTCELVSSVHESTLFVDATLCKFSLCDPDATLARATARDTSVRESFDSERENEGDIPFEADQSEGLRLVALSVFDGGARMA